MSLILDQNAPRRANNSNQIILNFSFFVAAFILLLAICAGSAWAMEPQKNSNVTNSYLHMATFNSSSSLHNSSPAAADSCIPLLDKINQSSFTEEAANRNQRSAGQVAVLGLALGMRFALEPSPSQPRNAASLEMKSLTQGNVKAINIIQYRRCLKEKALLTAMR